MICNKCVIDKPLTDKYFRPNLTSKFGFRRDCRDCEAGKAREKWKANPEHGRAILRAYLNRLTPEQRTQRRKDARQWQEENHDRNREHKNRAQTKRQMKKKGVYEEDIEILVLLERDDGVCGICGDDIDCFAKKPDPLSPSVDHIQPISGGGAHAYWNVQAAHLGCNILKGGVRA